MKKTYLLVFIVLCVFSITAYSQDYKNLTRQDYYDDFDTLQKWITDVSTVYMVNDKLKGQDFLAEMKKLRKRIEKVNSNEDFLVLVYHTLNLLQDPHGNLLTQSFLVRKQLMNPADAAMVDESCKYYDSLRSKAIRSADIKPDFPIKYVNGKYVVFYPFTINGVFVDTGYIVTKLNGRNIHKALLQVVPEVPFYQYDFQNKISYFDRFYKLRSLYANNDNAFKMELSNSRNSIVLHLKKSDKVTVDGEYKNVQASASDDGRKVAYFDDLGILYIRMPQTRDSMYYITEVQKLLLKHPRKIVFDTRGNVGGDDKVWESVLKLCIRDNEIKRSFFWAIRNTGFQKSRMQSFVPPAISAMPQFTAQISGVSKHSSFHVFKPEPVYYPGNQSGDEQAGIYILCNGYEDRAIRNFIDLARNHPRITTVGMSTGMFYGYNLAMLPFMLPKSKIIFRLSASLDFNNVQEVEDLYHDKIEMPYYYTVRDLYNIAVHTGDVSETDFLLTKDPLFRKVKEIE